MKNYYRDIHYSRLFENNRHNLDIVLDKDQLLSLAALTIDLRQMEWLEEIKTRLQALR